MNHTRDVVAVFGSYVFQHLIDTFVRGEIAFGELGAGNLARRRVHIEPDDAIIVDQGIHDSGADQTGAAGHQHHGGIVSFHNGPCGGERRSEREQN